MRRYPRCDRKICKASNGSQGANGEIVRDQKPVHRQPEEAPGYGGTVPNRSGDQPNIGGKSAAEGQYGKQDRRHARRKVNDPDPLQYASKTDGGCDGDPSRKRIDGGEGNAVLAAKLLHVWHTQDREERRNKDQYDKYA